MVNQVSALNGLGASSILGALTGGPAAASISGGSADVFGMLNKQAGIDLFSVGAAKTGDFSASKLFTPVSGSTQTAAKAAGSFNDTLTNLLKNDGILSMPGTGAVGTNAATLFGGGLSALFASNGDIIGGLLSGGNKGQTQVGGLLTGIFGPASSGVASGLLAGGAVTGLDKDNPLSKIVGNVFDGVSKPGGIFSGLLSGLGTDGKSGNILGSLLNSPVGRGDLFGGIGQTMHTLFESFKTPPKK